MSHLWLDPLSHRPCHHSRYLQPVQGRPQAVHSHLWRELAERCRQYRYVRVSATSAGQVSSSHASVFRTLSQFHGSEIYLSSLFHGTGLFLLNFSVSMALGIAFGLGMSLTLKHTSLSLYPRIESCLVPLVAYTCYFFSNGLSMSGIVSLLF